jgi:predicted  nucleic acid-binding Zn-ribbon protein
MSDSLTLYRLQQLDLRLGQIEARLGVIQEALENNLLILEAKNRLEIVTGDLQNKENSLRTVDQLVQGKQVKIDQIESSLYGGAIKNPKELQDLQNDAVSLKRTLSTLEEQELENMIALENVQVAYKSALEDYTNLRTKVEEQNHNLTIEREILQKEARRLFTERQATTQSIAPEPLDLYEKIRIQRHGIAVTTISDNSCDSCGSVLTLAQQQAAHHSHQLFRCPSCGRIIYS